MWEYILDDDDVDADFVYETLDMTGKRYYYDREKRRVLTPYALSEVKEVAEAYGYRQPPARYRLPRLSREELLSELEAAKSLEVGNRHQLADYLMLIFLEPDREVLDAYLSLTTFYA